MLSSRPQATPLSAAMPTAGRQSANRSTSLSWNDFEPGTGRDLTRWSPRGKAVIRKVTSRRHPGHRKDGSQVSVEFTAVTLKDSGRVVSVVAVMRDVIARFEEMTALRSRQSKERPRIRAELHRVIPTKSLASKSLIGPY